MSLLQMLLIRGLIAKFWNKPYKHESGDDGVRNCMINSCFPYYVHQDIKEVVNDLNDAGYPFQMSWFEPFFEFRFPHYGTVIGRVSKWKYAWGLNPGMCWGKKCQVAVPHALLILHWKKCR